MIRSFGFIFAMAFLSVVSFAQEGQYSTQFDYINVGSNTLTTTHAAAYKIEIDSSFEFLGEFHHQPTYNNRQFNVSLAVFTKGTELLLLHAETYSDGSGGLDYSNLKRSKLDSSPFTTRTQCASAEDKEELSKNPEIAFIESKGFALKTPFSIEQHFATAPDGTAEIVISFGRPTKSCESNKAITAGELDKLITVTKLD